MFTILQVVFHFLDRRSLKPGLLTSVVSLIDEGGVPEFLP